MRNFQPFRSFRSLSFYVGCILLATYALLTLPNQLVPATIVLPMDVQVQEHPPTRTELLAAAIAARYQVSEAIALRAIESAHKAEKDVGVPYYITLATVAVESSFREKIINSSDHGLMQVNIYYHRQLIQKLGGVPTLMNPETNIKAGTLILAGYFKQSGGNAAKALRSYNGKNKTNDYPLRVLAEAEWIKHVV